MASDLCLLKREAEGLEKGRSGLIGSDPSRVACDPGHTPRSTGSEPDTRPDPVMPAKAGIQEPRDWAQPENLDSRLRGNDNPGVTTLLDAPPSRPDLAFSGPTSFVRLPVTGERRGAASDHRHRPRQRRIPLHPPGGNPMSTPPEPGLAHRGCLPRCRVTRGEIRSSKLEIRNKSKGAK